MKKKFFNSFKVISIFLIVLVVILIIYVYSLLKNDSTYVFSATGNYVNITNGVISLNNDINLFNGSGVSYIKEKDIVVKSYTIGYYANINDKATPIVFISDTDEEGFSLKSVLEGVNSFNLVELSKNHLSFTNDIKSSFNDRIYFIITATDKKNNEITETIEITPYKLSK